MLMLMLMHTRMRISACLFAGLTVLAGLGCVERSLTIGSTPNGALVWLNDKEVGRTPVTVPFEWYGDYDIILRKPGFESLKTHRRINAPWYQYAPIDFFAELLIPVTVRDDRTLQFELKPARSADKEKLLDRAFEMRTRAGAETSARTVSTEGQ